MMGESFCVFDFKKIVLTFMPDQTNFQAFS
jgi:hypothetical protein